jgi:hypothetical protein
MKHARTTPRSDSARQLRAQRGAAAVMAQYVHELSGRHERFTLRQPVEPEPAEKAAAALGGQR